MNRIAHFSTGVERVGVMRMGMRIGVRAGTQKRWLATHAETPAATTTRDGKTPLERALNAPPKNTWTKDDISSIYNTPLMELTYAAVLLLFLRIQADPR